MISPETMTAGPARCADAAQLVLLQRVGLAVGEDVLSHLQTILLVYELLRAGLAKPEVDLDALREHAEWIKPAVQRAMSASAAAAEWLLPPEGARTPSTELAAECVALLRPQFELGGLHIGLASEGQALPLPRAQGRTMLCALLAHVADQAQRPQGLLVQLEHRAGLCVVRVSRRPLARAVATDFLQPPRQAPLEWADLVALAQRDGVAVRREGDQSIVLELAAARTSPS